MRDGKSAKATKPGSPMQQPEAMPAKTDPSLSRNVQETIGRQLRAMYDDVVHQGIPDRFVDLLNRLEKNGGKKS